MLPRPALLLPILFALLAALGCGHPTDPPAPCPMLQCKIACDDAGTREDDRTKCATCLCARAIAPDGGGACPALKCNGTCGPIGNASDPITGCPTCACCNPADCISGRNGHGADGCPTCGPC